MNVVIVFLMLEYYQKKGKLKVIEWKNEFKFIKSHLDRASITHDQRSIILKI